MITVRFDLSAFKDCKADGNSMKDEAALDGELPAIAYVDVVGPTVLIHFDASEPLTWDQHERLSGVVIRHDAQAAYLQQQRDGMSALVVEHAELFGAGFMGRRKNAALAAVAQAETPAAAQRVAELYLGRSLA